jgi:centrosomal CEP192-like protein
MKVPTAGVVTALAVFSLMLISPSPAPCQTEGGGPTVIPEIQHVTSPPLRELVQVAPGAVAPRVIPLRRIPPPQRGAVAPQVPDPVVQESAGPLAGTTSGLNFDGIAADGFIPPDTNGAVGATQFVETVNTEFAVYDKSNGALLLGPSNFSTLFSVMPGLGLCTTGNLSDPIVLYDKAAGRWLLSIAAFNNTSNLECVAVSTSSDAMGSYHLYSFSFGSNLNDYPKFGVWPDAYYLSVNIFPNGGFFSGPQACAIDRTNMLAGNAATMQCFQKGTFSLLPSDLDGSTAPPGGSPNFFIELGTSTTLNLFKFHVDFTTPTNSTFIGPTNIPVATYTQACGGGTCIPQKGTTQQLDSLGDRLMFRLAYRNFGDHESLVVNHSVQVGTGAQTGVRWYEVRDPNGTPTIFQQSTFGPDANFRWMGSIAMDHTGDMAVGYSVSSSSSNPQIHCTGRLPSDPLGTMEAEATIIDGNGSQLPITCVGGNPCGQRWGDYTSMSIDPVDDCTFWYSNEYLAADGDFNWKTRIGSFKFPSCSTSMATATLSPTSIPFNNQLVNTMSTAQTVTLTNGGNATLTLSIAITGTNSGDFSQSNTCGASVAAGANCSISVTFKPTATGNRAASVSITDNAAGSPQDVPLTGTGIAPALTLSLTGMVFGSFNVGSTAPTSNVQLTDSGTATLNISSIMLTGSDPSQFALVAPTSGSPACLFGANTITVGSSCFLGVQFKPTTAGAHSANVSVSDDASGSPQTVALVGTGTDLSIGPATGGSTSATVTAGQTATYNLQVSPVSGFNGTVTLGNCSGAPSGAACSVSPSSVLVNGTAASAFTVSVTTTAPSMIAPHIGPPNWPPLTSLRLIFLLLFALALLAILGRLRGTAMLPQPGLALAPALALVLLILAWVGGCGGGGSSASALHNPGTPKGTSSLTVTATSGGLSHTLNLTLTVN